MSVTNSTVVSLPSRDNSMMGIYGIKNILNNKIYIGSARDIHGRKLEHLRDLRKGIHPNNHLQRSFVRDGEDSFTHEILELVEDDNFLLEREMFWVKKYNSMKSEFGYNFCPPVKGGETNREFRQKVEGERNGRWILKAKDIPKICARINNNDSNSSVAKSFEVNLGVINSILSGKRWRDLAEIYLSDEKLSKWKIPPKPRGIHPDIISMDTLKSICILINERVSDEKIALEFGLSETGVACIRKGGCWCEETFKMLDDEILMMWPYNIDLIKHLIPPQKVRKSPELVDEKSNRSRKISNTQVVEICKLLNERTSTKIIANKYGVSNASIQFIRAGKQHRSIAEIHLDDLIKNSWNDEKIYNSQRPKMTESIVIDICNLLNAGMKSVEIIAKEVNVSGTTVKHIRTGETHREIGLKYLNADIITKWWKKERM